MTESPFEADQRARARASFQAGEYRAALNVWDSLDHPELLSDEEVAMFEAARLHVYGDS